MIGGAGLAMMIWKEAQRRMKLWNSGVAALSRRVPPCGNEPCEFCEYYRLQDKIWDDWNSQSTYSKMRWAPRITL